MAFKEDLPFPDAKGFLIWCAILGGIAIAFGLLDETGIMPFPSLPKDTLQHNQGMHLLHYEYPQYFDTIYDIDEEEVRD